MTRVRRARGMTLIEMLIAMVVFSVVLGGAVSVFRSQSRGFTKGTDQMTVLQNLRYAATTLETDLRAAGANVPDIQPFIIYAGDNVVAVNADYTTNIANDAFAIYYDPDAQTGEVTAMGLADRFTLPGTSFSYPDTNYVVGGVNSPAETLTFFFTADSSTLRSDDFALFRRVNDQAPALVARNLLAHPSGAPFFEYYRVLSSGTGSSTIGQVPGSALPLSHSVPIHLSLADTSGAAVVDSIRGVRVNFTATNGITGTEELKRSVTRLVRLPNAGLASRRTCGDEPLLGVAMTATPGPNPGDPIGLNWLPATDESSGEKDVVRYVIYRRSPPVATWGDPYLSIPSGQPGYVFNDAAVVSGQQYFYALAAQDCTPSLSSLFTVGPVTAP